MYLNHICDWGVSFDMKNRLIIHYNDGKTITSDWLASVPFDKSRAKKISSLQLQKEDGKLFTLSGINQPNTAFYYRNSIKNGTIHARSIMKRLYRNIWLELKLFTNKEKPEILIIKEKIDGYRK